MRQRRHPMQWISFVRMAITGNSLKADALRMICNSSFRESLCDRHTAQALRPAQLEQVFGARWGEKFFSINCHNCLCVTNWQYALRRNSDPLRSSTRPARRIQGTCSPSIRRPCKASQGTRGVWMETDGLPPCKHSCDLPYKIPNWAVATLNAGFWEFFSKGLLEKWSDCGCSSVQTLTKRPTFVAQPFPIYCKAHGTATTLGPMGGVTSTIFSGLGIVWYSKIMWNSCFEDFRLQQATRSWMVMDPAWCCLLQFGEVPSAS